jgi:predicted ribosomally synthesized peptide with nif11-like leader
MTTEAAAAFAERLKTDEAFQSKLAGAASGEERLALAREEGFALTAADAGAIKEALGIEELSDEDLEKVAGGTGVTTAVSTGGSIVTTAVTVAVVAAAI